MRDLLSLNPLAVSAREKMELDHDVDSLEWNQGPVIDVNAKDAEDSTPLCLALKSKTFECAKYLLKYFADKIDITVKSKKHGNIVNLAIKT